MLTPQLLLDVNEEIIVDNFAGGGGASTGIELALGRHVEVAINHDPQAVSMHQANHPQTRHYCESVWDVDPREVEPGRPIGLLWLSPDCKHFSKAKGGKPVEKKIRALAWVALRWVAIRRPRVVYLENVEEFVTWGPVVCGPDGTCKPCPRRKGREFGAFINALKRHGYAVEWRELRACDYGAPTIRKRLFLIARCDGKPINWPEPTHGDPKSDAVKRGHLKPWHTAAECIDWSLPCQSIFERKRPLADATLRRVAKGVMRYVVNAAEPFIVPMTHHGDVRVHPGSEALRTITSAHRGELALCSPTLVQTGYGERQGQAPRVPGLDKPLGTIVAGATKHALVGAFIAKHYGDTGQRPGSECSEPLSTITASDHNGLITAQLVGCGGRAGQSRPRDAGEPMQTITAKADTALITSNLVKLRGGGNIGQPDTEPLRTISAGGTHFAEVRAFLTAYYGTDQDPRLTDPMHTVPTKDRFGLVTVQGQEYAITDIGLRMLAPAELFRAQGFPSTYIIDHGVTPEGKRIPLTKTAQVRMCGNSVSPPMAAALVRANLAELAIRRAA